MPGSSDDQTETPVETEPLVAHILALLGKVTDQFDSNEHGSWQWFAQHSQNPHIVDVMRELSMTAWRVIDAIGRLEPVNGITISAQFRIPKGTVSKVTRRLIAQNVVSTEFLPNNKKEILFRLTPLGRELANVHRAFDAQMERGFVRFLQRYSPDELRLLARVLQDATEASFLALGLQAPAVQEQAEPLSGEQTADHI
jgi:DNA-binding MarR family transcriptional regulator